MSARPGVALYRVFDDEDALLYVGVSERPWIRFQHAANTWWWALVDSLQLEFFSTRAEALAAEKAAIAIERPIHNGGASTTGEHRGVATT